MDPVRVGFDLPHSVGDGNQLFDLPSGEAKLVLSPWTLVVKDLVFCAQRVTVVSCLTYPWVRR